MDFKIIFTFVIKCYRPDIRVNLNYYPIGIMGYSFSSMQDNLPFVNLPVSEEG
jgi:hypothetical protein